MDGDTLGPSTKAIQVAIRYVKAGRMITKSKWRNRNVAHRTNGTAPMRSSHGDKRGRRRLANNKIAAPAYSGKWTKTAYSSHEPSMTSAMMSPPRPIATAMVAITTDTDLRG